MKKGLFVLLTLIMMMSLCLPMSVQATSDIETTVAVTDVDETQTTDVKEEESTLADETETTDSADEETTAGDEPSSEITEEPSSGENEPSTEESSTDEDESTTDEPSTDGDESTTDEPTTDEPTTEEPVDEHIEDVVSLDGKTILIAGNSMVYYGNCVIRGDQGKADYGYFYQLIASNGEEATVIDHTYAGKKLSYIYDTYLTKLTAEELDAVDYVVVCEAFQENNDLLGTCQKIMALFPEDTQFRFMCHPMMYDQNMLSLVNGVETLRENNIMVVDWGKMAYDVYTGAVAVPGATLTYDRCTFIKDNEGYKNGRGAISSGGEGDRKHPNILSGYITAQMLYTSITNRSAVLSDYSFCDDNSIHRFFNIDAFAQAHYTGTKTTNFNQVFRSPQDMVGLQTLIDTYLAKEGKHPLTVLEAVEPGCTSGGLTQGSYCTVCGEIVKPQEYIQSKGGHTLVYNKAIEPTCTVDGRTSGISCSVCNEEIVKSNIKPAIGHDVEEVIIKGTDTADGAINTVCGTCNEIVMSVTISRIQTVELEKYEYTCDGKSKKPEVVVKDAKGNVLKKGTDYSLSYSRGRKNIGEYTVTVKYKGNYQGQKVLTFRILPGKTSTVTTMSYPKSIRLTWTAVNGATGYQVSRYNSSTKKYEVVANTSKNTLKVKKLTAGKKYKFRVTAYTKSGTITYFSNEFNQLTAVTSPSKVSMKSVSSSGSGAVSVRWSKVAGANGYQVICSDSKSFTNAKTLTVSKQRTKKATISNLISGKTCYVKVRAYKTINGNKVYGAYSSVKSVSVR